MLHCVIALLVLADHLTKHFTRKCHPFETVLYLYHYTKGAKLVCIAIRLQPTSNLLIIHLNNLSFFHE